ncbi:DUF2063 domain-containing protein [Shewanella waksmanii]|uniref:HvfC family RiPP maturation protein n=1 Tax=Shewanella waksmanii TaxID=213783 RepID=UPI003736A94F
MAFTDIQQGFIDYIRDPSRPLPEGIEQRRMTVYRELFFNNVNGFVSNAFPVLCSLYQQQDWLDLVQKFFANHNCKTPLFIEIAQEFLAFLQNEYQPTEHDPEFMLELAHYEWLELCVATERDNPLHILVEQQSIDSGVLVISDSAKIAQYHYEVHKISPDFQPEQPLQQPSFFCVYRDFSDEVCFLQLNPLSAQVLALISQQDGVTYEQVLTWLTETYVDMDKAVLAQGSQQMLDDMAQKGIVRFSKFSQG